MTQSAELRADEKRRNSSPSYLPDEIRKLLETELTVDAETAGLAFGLGRSAAYAAARKQEIPSYRIGYKLVCPTAPIRRMLGLEPSTLPVQQTAMSALPLQQAAPTAKKVSPPKRRQRRRR